MYCSLDIKKDMTKKLLKILKVIYKDRFKETESKPKCQRCGAKNKPLKNGLCYGCMAVTDN